MFYLTTHSTHFIYGYMASDHSDSENGRKEGNVLFNDTLNTFYLRLYGVRHMVKDHSDSEIEIFNILYCLIKKGSFLTLFVSIYFFVRLFSPKRKPIPKHLT